MPDDVPATAAPEGLRGEGTPDPAGHPADRPWTALWVTALALPPLALLAAASWFGRWVRPGADDWCFLPAVRDDGVTGLVGKFYLDDNGRVANALLVGAYAKFQVAGHQWYPWSAGSWCSRSSGRWPSWHCAGPGCAPRAGCRSCSRP